MKTYYRGYYTPGNNTFIETAKAIGVYVSFGKWSGTDSHVVWFPKSQLVFEDGLNDAGKASMLIPCWLFRKNQIDPNCVDSITIEDRNTIER